MTIIDYSPEAPNEVKQFAAGLAGRANQVADQLVQMYRANFEMLWYRDGWDKSNVQAIADEMGVAFTQMMAKNRALGEFIDAQYPGQIPESELASPISYTVNPDGTITFDGDEDYPGPQTTTE